MEPMLSLMSAPAPEVQISDGTATDELNRAPVLIIVGVWTRLVARATPIAIALLGAGRYAVRGGPGFWD